MNDNIEYTGVHGLNCTPEPCPKGTSMTEQRPIAWVTGYKTGQCVIVQIDGSTIFPTGLALFAAPSNREWVDLTIQEIRDVCAADYDEYFNKVDILNVIMIARAIEAKLKEKNHD